jgi:AcrR family transcriptional regulator
MQETLTYFDILCQGKRRLSYLSGMAEARGYHHGNLRRALLDAAAKLVAERGADRFTMADAGRRAGVSSGAPYRHFPDREALMSALASEAATQLEEALDASLRTAGPTALDRFRAAGMAYVRFATEHPGHFIVLSMPEYGLGDSRLQPPADDAYWKALKSWVTSHSAHAKLDPAHPLIGQLAGRVLVHGLAHAFVVGLLPGMGIGADRAGQLAEAVTRAVSVSAFDASTAPGARGPTRAKPRRRQSKKR